MADLCLFPQDERAVIQDVAPKAPGSLERQSKKKKLRLEVRGPNYFLCQNKQVSSGILRILETSCRAGARGWLERHQAPLNLHKLP